MKTKRQKVIARLIKRARQHYREAQVPDYMDCGMHMAGIILGRDLHGHYDKYENCVARLRRVDPAFPKGD